MGRNITRAASCVNALQKDERLTGLVRTMLGQFRIMLAQ